jgi:hypothetical protein
LLLCHFSPQLWQREEIIEHQRIFAATFLLSNVLVDILFAVIITYYSNYLLKLIRQGISARTPTDADNNTLAQIQQIKYITLGINAFFICAFFPVTAYHITYNFFCNITWLFIGLPSIGTSVHQNWYLHKNGKLKEEKLHITTVTTHRRNASEKNTEGTTDTDEKNSEEISEKNSPKSEGQKEEAAEHEEEHSENSAPKS